MFKLSEVEQIGEPSETHLNVTKHYNALSDNTTGHRRALTDAFMLRKFNNWVKAVLIGEYATFSPCGKRDSFRNILDICCGKGGDMAKWGAVRPGVVVMVDAAAVSIDDLRNRFNSTRNPNFNPRTAVADCGNVRLTSIPGLIPAAPFGFDTVSCQFALHYCFESEARARALLFNASERLLPGGIFIGTIPDANALLKYTSIGPGAPTAFSNSVVSVRFHHDPHEFSPLHPFGIKYTFDLASSVVDCAEYLVHFPTLQTIALEFGLELVARLNFHQIWTEYSVKRRDLLHKLKVFDKAGSISKDEWECASKCSCIYSTNS